MTEAARVSVALEVTGLDQAATGFSKFEADAKKAGSSVQGALDKAGKETAGVSAMIAKLTGDMSSQMAKLDKTMTAGFSGSAAAMNDLQKSVKAAQASAAPATAAIEKMASTAKTSATQAAEAVGELRAEMAQVVPGVTAAGAGMKSLGDGFGRVGSQAKVANDNIRLTTGQMQGLGYPSATSTRWLAASTRSTTPTSRSSRFVCRPSRPAAPTFGAFRASARAAAPTTHPITQMEARLSARSMP